jgi:hypothetical protein
MTRCELATALLDEIERTRAQLERLRTAFVTRQEERTSGMDKCEECQSLWKAYQKATIQSVQLDEEVRSMTEDESLQKFSEATTKAEAAEQLRVEARQRLTEHQAATGHR